MTFVIADVLFPAFYSPYLAQLTYPLSALALLSVEWLVFARLNRQQPRSRLLLIVFVANLTSSLAGAAIAVSVVLEYVVVRGMTRRVPLRHPGLAVIATSVASYFVLLVATEASAWWSQQ